MRDRLWDRAAQSEEDVSGCAPSEETLTPLEGCGQGSAVASVALSAAGVLGRACRVDRKSELPCEWDGLEMGKDKQTELNASEPHIDKYTTQAVVRGDDNMEASAAGLGGHR
ncbi:hypothetical protein NDU88_001692 [Pleurodeles waltl]|uniref:Uncharacterized protein n=1 Tax=Pleurodeles waltl TaxID=8319 RepID=A0AAV7VBS1_PLEWA|nr:hypothetical protein NDU88_001692 [Pleurodeles waltl]